MLDKLEIDRMLEDLGQDPYLRADFLRGPDAVVDGYLLPEAERDALGLDIRGQRDYLVGRMNAARPGGEIESTWTGQLIACEADELVAGLA